jgi:endogenous inhibitor of DNA gyrase (YacG/DUF329 family)
VTGAEQHTCPACGGLFTWTAAAPRQRFCSTPCRQRWWDRNRRRRSRQDRDDPHGHDPRGHGPRHTADDPRRPAGPRGNSSAGTLAAVPACPHCRKPVAIVAWLVPPTAASVATPLRHAPGISDYQ